MLHHCTVLHAAVPHGRVVHLPLHGDHFLLMPGMHGRVAEAELMRHRALVDQHEAYGFPGLDLQTAWRVVHVAHDDLHGTISLGSCCRRAKGK
ncbi:hypothetical protein D3C75_801060 [compost metagenome]